MIKTSKRLFLLSLGYWFSAHSLGLILHPYQSMRRLSTNKLYRPLTFLPLVTFLFWWLLGFVVSRFNVLATLGLPFFAVQLEHWSPTQIALSFIFAWGIILLLLWQTLLMYLYFRFKPLTKTV